MGEIERRVKGVGTDTIPVKVSEKAYDQERFGLLRDELWWRMREAFERGMISIPDDPILKGDLNAPRYDDSTGRIVVESKDKMKKRGIESPNRADALMMTFLSDESTLRRIYSRSSAPKKRSAGRSWRTL